MSAEREVLSFDEDVDPDHDVDPADVDWEAIFDEYAGSDGLLDMSTRVDVVGKEVDGIGNSRQAESLLEQAADAGCIEERGTDYYFETDSSSEIDANDVDWESVFESVAGGVTEPLPPSEIKRSMGIKSELGLESEDDAAKLEKEARDRGILVLDDVGEKRCLFLSDALEQAKPTPSATETSPTSETDETPQTRPELEALRNQSDGVEEYVGSLEGLLTDVLDRLEAVEERQDRQEERANRFFKENQRQRVGVTEIQMERLQEGKVISRDGVDESVLEDEFGDNLAIVGDNSNHIRLMNPDTEQSGGGGATTEIPDFGKYCDLEAELLKINYKVKSKDELLNERGGKNKYRALVVWRNKFLVGDTQRGKLQISGKDVRETILEYAQFDASEGGMDTTANRVMDRFAEWTNGTLTKELDEAGRSCLQGDVEEVKNECCPQFRSREGEGGTEVVSPISMDEIS